MQKKTWWLIIAAVLVVIAGVFGYRKIFAECTSNEQCQEVDASQNLFGSIHPQHTTYQRTPNDIRNY